MKKIFFPIILVTLLIMGCQKEFTFTDGTVPTPPDSTGGNGGPCDSYFPTTLGSFWNYSNTQGPDNTLTITAPDTLINGKTFKRVKSTQSTDAFVRDDNGSIYQYADFGISGTVMMNILRVNAAVRETWTDVSVINGVTETFEYKILEKNITVQISNATFSNVIHSQYTVTLNQPPLFNNDEVQVTEAWFAKCIGPLQTKTVTTYLGVTSDTLTTQIKSYQIK